MPFCGRNCGLSGSRINEMTVMIGGLAHRFGLPAKLKFEFHCIYDIMLPKAVIQWQI